jgi:hypothetical protein
MNVNETLTRTYPVGPGLPPGGSPQIDAAYEQWLHPFVARVNKRWLDEHTGWGRNLPKHNFARRNVWHHLVPELVRSYQITGHLFKWLNGAARYPEGLAPNYMHRLRFVAVQFHHRRAELIEESQRYVTELAQQQTERHDDASTKGKRSCRTACTCDSAVSTR